MLSSTVIVASLTSIAIASPLLVRDTIVIEELFEYPDGEIISTAYITSTTSAQPTQVPIPQGFKPSSPASGSNGQGQAGDSSDLTDTSMGTVAYIQQHGQTDVGTTTGFVDPSDSLFSRIALFHTNAHRVNSSVPALTWDQDLADKAQAWANLCVMDEGINRPDGTGSNAAWSSSGDYNPSEFISEQWYNGEFNNYPWGEGDAVSNQGDAFEGYGHLSQLLWESTTAFGCGIKNDCGGTWASHALCYYSPPGNYGGQFSKVGQPTGGPTLRSNGN